MHSKIRMLTLAGFLVLTSIAATAQEPQFSNLYVFGDSYCDVGNLYAPSPPYYQHRWSNGPLWVEHIAGFLGVPPLTPSSIGGTDYAWDGAAVTEASFTPSIPQQVERYLADHGGKADPGALFILEGGTNDILQTSFTNPEELGYQIALGLANSEQRLRDAGARHILMTNLLDVGLLPIAATKSSLASAVASATNKWLDVLLSDDRRREAIHMSAEERREGIQILHFNLFALVHAVGKDPTHFGFTNLTDPCRVDTTLCADPDHSFFFDDVHPSEFAQAYFAVAVETILATQDLATQDLAKQDQDKGGSD